MDDDVRQFGMEFGRAALARSWDKVHGMLAPWLRSEQSVAAEVTDQNRRYWMSLRLQCSDAQMETMDFDTFCEIWLAVVETSEGLRVGYWSQGAY